MRWYLIWAFVLLIAGCATPATVTRLSSVEPIVVTWRVWGPNGAEEPPSELKEAVETDLRARGFQPVASGTSDYAMTVDVRAAEPIRFDKQYRWSLTMRATFSQIGTAPRYIESSYAATVSRPSESALMAIEASSARMRDDIAREPNVLSPRFNLAPSPGDRWRQGSIARGTPCISSWWTDSPMATRVTMGRLTSPTHRRFTGATCRGSSIISTS
ncbi:MAG: hypothetical protein R3E66_14895 [bacterium]